MRGGMGSVRVGGRHICPKCGDWANAFHTCRDPREHSTSPMARAMDEAMDRLVADKVPWAVLSAGRPDCAHARAERTLTADEPVKARLTCAECGRSIERAQAELPAAWPDKDKAAAEA